MAAKKYGNKGRVTRQDVADYAGVSTAIVSYVVNDGPRNVAPHTRQKVLDAIEKLGYRPNRNAQRLTRQSWGTQVVRGQYGIILGGGHGMILRPYYAAILHGIYIEAEAYEREIRFMQVFNIYRDPLLFNQLVHPEEITGLAMLVPSTMVQPGHIKELQEVVERMQERVPNLILVDNQAEGVRSVTIDRQQAAEQAVQHLCELGHRRIAYVGSTDEREVGYRAAMAAHDNPLDERMIRSEVSGNRTTEAYTAIHQMMQTISSHPSAVFAASDEVAVGVYQAVRELGLRIPDDVSVVSIDDTPYATTMMPALSTVHLPAIKMGVQALRLLVQHEDGDEDSASRSVVMPTELIVRESTQEYNK